MENEKEEDCTFEKDYENLLHGTSVVRTGFIVHQLLFRAKLPNYMKQDLLKSVLEQYRIMIHDQIWENAEREFQIRVENIKKDYEQQMAWMKEKHQGEINATRDNTIHEMERKYRNLEAMKKLIPEDKLTDEYYVEVGKACWTLTRNEILEIRKQPTNLMGVKWLKGRFPLASLIEMKNLLDKMVENGLVYWPLGW